MAVTFAQAFQEHYYNTFDSNRQALSGLYKDDAFLSFEGQGAQGSQAITQKLTSLPFQQVCQASSAIALHVSVLPLKLVLSLCIQHSFSFCR